MLEIFNKVSALVYEKYFRIYVPHTIKRHTKEKGVGAHIFQLTIGLTKVVSRSYEAPSEKA